MMIGMRLLWLWVLGVVSVAVIYLLAADVWVPVQQRDMEELRIYAYREWQSSGIRLEDEEVATLRAEGEWLYTPDEFHGPEGHPRYPAPDFYPVMGVPGGVLLARVGETGTPTVVGSRGSVWVPPGAAGMLYFRINDDVLSDNDGYVTVDITVEEPEEP
jgi:hypothetical protein